MKANYFSKDIFLRHQKIRKGPEVMEAKYYVRFSILPYFRN